MVEEERKKLELSGGTTAKKGVEKKSSKKKKDKKAKSLDFPDKVFVYFVILEYTAVRLIAKCREVYSTCRLTASVRSN